MRIKRVKYEKGEKEGEGWGAKQSQSRSLWNNSSCVQIEVVSTRRNTY